MFLHLSVILFTEGSAFPQCHGKADPSECNPLPPFRRQTLPLCQDTDTNPGYGQQVGGTQPTGMHTCFNVLAQVFKTKANSLSVWYGRFCVMIYGGKYCTICHACQHRVLPARETSIFRVIHFE